MQRVVVTGMGIVASIGNNKQAVLDSLLYGRSGIERCEEYAEMGMRSQVEGSIRIELDQLIERKVKRFMGESAAYNYVAAREAIADAGLTDEDIDNPRVGLVCGSGGASTANVVAAADLLRSKGVKRVGPYMVTRTMSSTNSACITTALGIKGVSYSISSACATSAHCIGHGAELIQLGKQDIVLAGGGDEVHWSMSCLFDAMAALSSKYNDTPQTASRPYDLERDGFVISGGGGVLILEELEHARRRGAKVYAELVGYGATSDGADMVQPSGEGAMRCMRQAMATVEDEIDYINAHGTSTPVGDVKELEALRAVFSDKVPPISSTKSLTGHGLGAAGVHEAIYSLIMLEHDFICGSANIQQIDPVARDFPIIQQTKRDAGLTTVMSNSFGFGGTNATLVFRKFDD